MISYLKIGLYILFMLIYYNSSEQTNADFLNWQQNLKTAKPFFTDYKTFFEIKVKEVTDTTKPFSFDSGPVFGYCGDIVGGIKNLLQTNISSTPHVFFENKPLQSRYVLFYGFGSNMDGSKISDTSKCYSNVNSFNGREIVLKILEQQFNFEVIESQDSLEYMELKILDYNKLLLHKTPVEKCNHGGWAMEDSINNNYLGTCSSLVWISARIEKKLNIYNEDQTNTSGTYYEYMIPLDLFETKEKLPQLSNYLEENMGLTIVKTKRLETIYTIKFNITP